LAALEEAFSQFVADHGDRAVRLAYVTLRDRRDAEDVVQEAFYRLWRHSLRHGAETLSAALLYQAVVNLCRDRARYRHRHPEDTTDPALLTAPAPPGPDREQAMVILNAVHSLQPIERQVILLFYYLDQSLKDTAAILGLSEQLVKTRLFRARQHLKPLLEPIVREEVT
jgi:RNA polymerase sigma-70 factor (ECF subfamily)